MTPKT